MRGMLAPRALDLACQLLCWRVPKDRVPIRCQDRSTCAIGCNAAHFSQRLKRIIQVLDHLNGDEGIKAARLVWQAACIEHGKFDILLAGAPSSRRGNLVLTSAFQISAPVQPGNSGGPLLDMNGRVVGMAQGILGTLRAAEALGGAIPQNVNVGITATTIIGFLQAHSVDYRIDTERTKFEPEQIAEEAKKFTVKVTCE
jgi:Trypsin-like peptidase domain